MSRPFAEPLPRTHFLYKMYLAKYDKFINTYVPKEFEHFIDMTFSTEIFGVNEKDGNFQLDLRFPAFDFHLQMEYLTKEAAGKAALVLLLDYFRILQFSDKKFKLYDLPFRQWVTLKHPALFLTVFLAKKEHRLLRRKIWKEAIMLKISEIKEGKMYFGFEISNEGEILFVKNSFAKKKILTRLKRQNASFFSDHK